MYFDPPTEKTHKINYSEKELELHQLYQFVHEFRRENSKDFEKLKVIFEKLKTFYKKDWLLVLEIYEISFNEKNGYFSNEILAYLTKLSKQKAIKHLIEDGIELIEKA